MGLMLYRAVYVYSYDWHEKSKRKLTNEERRLAIQLIFMPLNALILPERKWNEWLISGAERKKNPFDMYFPYGPQCVLCTYTLTNTETNKQTLPWHQFEF